MGPMGGDAMSQPASPQAGGTPQLPGSLQGPLGPGAAWSTGQWPPRPRPWAQMGPEPPPQMGPAPHRPHLHPGEGVLDFMKTPHYWPGMRDPMAAYQAWLFWGRVQHGNPFFHHKQQYPELPHTPHAPGTHWGLPGYPGGPSQWPTGRLPPMR
ncbi:MAG: hypothetical protein FJZ01_16270 [Candidatus Sericytochromatia bacterium]|nr:hypothetical protein [Candidatus Tanganyikabacteria bacterium]